MCVLLVLGRQMASLDACKTLAASTLGAETPGTEHHCVRIISEFLSLKEIIEDRLIPLYCIRTLCECLSSRHLRAFMINSRGTFP